jgi:hypothetical protein
MQEIIETLSTLRVDPVIEEFELQKKIGEALHEAGISFEKEYRLGPRNRVDFLTSSGIAIEVKKGQPNKRQVVDQLRRYAEFPEVCGIILVVEKSLQVPHMINGKPCMSLGLNKLWGIAL